MFFIYTVANYGRIIFIMQFFLIICLYIKQNGLRNFFRAPFRWILFGDSSNINEDIVPEAVANKDLLLDSEVLVARSVDDIYELHFSKFLHQKLQQITAIQIRITFFHHNLFSTFSFLIIYYFVNWLQGGYDKMIKNEEYISCFSINWYSI